MANKITKLPTNSQQNNLETFTNEHDKEIAIRKTRNYWWTKIAIEE